MKTKVLLASALLFISLNNILAQENEKRFGFELSTGISVPTSKLGDATLNTGLGIEGTFHYRFMPHTGIYAGWGWNRFSADKSFAGNEMDFEETGYVFGLQFKHPVNNSRLSYYLRGAGLYNHIEIENEEGDILHNTGHGLGFQLAGGLEIPLGTKWSLTPGIKFNYLSRDLEIEGLKHQLDLNYIQIRVGIAKKF